ncbi:MAG: hypothetical protein CL908_24370 [Deltaproteobacteria bacterium]|nr:hypothetical protein [Deltaproteobacteria bacterium]
MDASRAAKPRGCGRLNPSGGRSAIVSRVFFLGPRANAELALRGFFDGQPDAEAQLALGGSSSTGREPTYLELRTACSSNVWGFGSVDL